MNEGWHERIASEPGELGYKDWPLGTLSPAERDALIAEELTDEQVCNLIEHMGTTFKPEMTRRSAFTSELFPMMPYICMSLIEDFHTYPDRVKVIEAAQPAQEIARAHRGRPAQLSPLWTLMVGYHYLCGRECLIHSGRIAPGDEFDRVRTVIDFWRRMALAQRGDGTLDNKDAGDSNRYLPDGVVRELAELAQPLGESRRALNRLDATLSSYAFLLYTESRVGIYDSGPYDLGDGRTLIVRDYMRIGRSRFPWSDAVDPPFSSFTLPLVFSNDTFEKVEINDWGTTFPTPEPFLPRIDAAAVIAHTSDGDELLAPDAWPELQAQMSKTHVSLYQRIAAMDRFERITSAAKTYCWGLLPFAEPAGVADAIDWEISERTMALYPDPLDDDEQCGAMFAGALMTHDRPSAFSRPDASAGWRSRPKAGEPRPSVS
ncbi:MAG TPA: hypothetical protein VHX88_17595 [Solirubrobacteraceae bacterium]|nr:hypothetical protein [Solirubrobacteraceae bacterium]